MPYLNPTGGGGVLPRRGRTIAPDDIRLALAMRSMGIPADDWMLYLMHLDMEWSDPHFNEAAPVTLLASAVRQSIVSFIMPGGTMLGLLRSICYGFEFLSDFDNVNFALEINGVPIQGYTLMRGPIGDFRAPLPLILPIQRGAKVEILASNLTAANIDNVTALVRGNFFNAPVGITSSTP